MTKSKIVVNSGIYTVISLLQKGINFLLVPVLTSYLTTHDYGIVAVVTAINAFLNVIYLLSLNGCLNRFYYEYKDDPEKIRVLFGTIVTFVILFSSTITVILVLGHSYLIDPFLEEVDFYPYMLLGMVSVLFNPVFTIYQNTLQAKQQGKLFGKNNMMFFLVNLGFLLFSVVLMGFKAEGVLGSLALTNIIFCFVTIGKFGKEIKFGIDLEILKQSLKYSLPLVPHSISGVATALIDRLFVNNMISTAAAGIYTLGSTFGGLIFLVASGVQQAFAPWFNQQIKNNQSHKIPMFASALVLVYCILALGVSFFSKELIQWVTPEAYHGAWKVVPIIAFAFVFHASYYFFSAPFFYDISGKGSRTLPFFTIMAAVLNICLNYFLIKGHGVMGAATAALLAKFFLVLALRFSYKRFEVILYDSKVLILVPILFFALAITVYLEPALIIKGLIYFITILFVVLIFRRKIRIYLNEYRGLIKKQ